MRIETQLKNHQGDGQGNGDAEGRKGNFVLTPSRLRSTLLAVGFAVLVSMVFAPHGGKHGVEGWGLFFSTNGFDLKTGISYGPVGRVMIDMLVLETVFLAVLFVIAVNIRWSRRAVRWATGLAVLTALTLGGWLGYQQEMNLWPFDLV
jgi:hypothetical protein